MRPPDEAAAEFERLVDAHYRPLFRFAMSLCGSEGTACDLVQQTFFQWAAKGHQLRDRERAKAWLFTTLHREFLQLVRRESRLVPLPAEHDSPAPEEKPAPPPEFLDGLDVATLNAALAEIPEAFRVPLSLFYLQEFSYAEIAELLGVPVGTVMSRLARGKQKLRRRLVASCRRREFQPLPFPAPSQVQHG